MIFCSSYVLLRLPDLQNNDGVGGTLGGSNLGGPGFFFFFPPAISSQSKSFSLLGTNTLQATGSPKRSGSACSAREEETGPVWAPHALRGPLAVFRRGVKEAQCSRLSRTQGGTHVWRSDGCDARCEKNMPMSVWASVQLKYTWLPEIEDLNQFIIDFNGKDYCKYVIVHKKATFVVVFFHLNDHSFCIISSFLFFSLFICLKKKQSTLLQYLCGH